MKKVLSVVVPAYNVEDYIQRCLDSLVYDEKIIDDLDIIVVNDGGTDKTVEIVKEYVEKYPKSIRLIDKKNGGHGSTINVGVMESVGKYIKIMDGDDWFNVFDFSDFVKKLKNETADIVITNYKREVLYNEKEVSFVFTTSDNEVVENIEKADINASNFFFKFSMPSMAIRTDKLRKSWGRGLPEKRFYVDQLFVAKVIIGADTYTVYNLDIYRHFIGRPDQSIGTEGFYNHRDDHEFVLRQLLKIYTEQHEGPKKEILKKQIVMMIDTQYQIYCCNRGLLKKDRKELVEFESFLKENYREFYDKKQYKIGLLRRIR
jgi:glycosyltransferase involved in cell wall biosynthesis